MNPLPFDASMIAEGGRLAAQILKDCQKETPPAAVIACAIVLVQAAKTAGLHRRRVIDLIQILDDSIQPDGHQREAAQDALAKLVTRNGH